MNRRDAIQSIAMASAATLFITGCSDRNVVEFLKDNRLMLNQKHTDYLTAISETFLPIKGISDKIDPAADFIMTMVNDTWSPENIIKFAQGFEQYKLLMEEAKFKIDTDEADKIVFMVKIILDAEEPQEELVYFINSVRQLSIRNLTSSEYYMINHSEYQMIPPPYEACITV